MRAGAPLAAAASAAVATAGDPGRWRRRCGSSLTPRPLLPVKRVGNPPAGIPTEFDARKRWPHCPSVGRIRDQSECGSCWAIAATEAYNDRRCIAGDGGNATLSAADTLSCASGSGCGGGLPHHAWEFFAAAGVVSGGASASMGTGASCKPYPFPPCAHHVSSKKYPPCPQKDYPTPKCAHSCTDTKYPTGYAADKRTAAEAYAVSGEAAIQSELLSHGPVSATYTVYEGMPEYKYGVYVNGNGAQLGGHAVKIIGWGLGRTSCYSVTAAIPDVWCARNCASGNCPSGSCVCGPAPAGNGAVPYWLIANSWNEEWGDKGFFKILRGANECGIEQNVYAGL